MTLRLDDRQHDILQEMGIALFERKKRLPSALAQHPAKSVISSGAHAAHFADGAHGTHGAQHAPSTLARAQTPIPLRSLGEMSTAASPTSHPGSGQHAPTKRPTSSPIIPLPDLEGLAWSELMDTCLGCQACSLGASAKARLFGMSAWSATQHARKPQEGPHGESTAQPKASRVLIVADSPQLDVNGQARAFSALSLPLFEQFLCAASWHAKPPIGASVAINTANTTGASNAASTASQDIMITHMVKCANPAVHVEAHQYLTCLGYLRAQIKLLKPQVLLIMGRMAAQALVHNTELQGLPHGKLCGRTLSFEGTPMVVTQAPEYLWRTGQDKAKSWHDLCLTLSLLEDPGAS